MASPERGLPLKREANGHRGADRCGRAAGPLALAVVVAIIGGS